MTFISTDFSSYILVNNLLLLKPRNMPRAGKFYKISGHAKISFDIGEIANLLTVFGGGKKKTCHR